MTSSADIDVNGHRPADATAAEVRIDRLCLGLLCAIVPVNLFLCVTLFSNASGDLRDYVLPWIDHIITHGRIVSLDGGYANYTPPYIYLLDLASWLDGSLSRVAIIKLLSIVFSVISGALVFEIARYLGRTVGVAALCALLFINLPTIMLDTVVWGQCDTIYVTFLLGFARAVIMRRASQAMVMFAIAFAFKLQTIFVLPFLAYLILTGFFRLRQVLIVPAVYALLMLPAWLAGRDWFQLLTIYLHQVGAYDRLSMDAPNPYLWIAALLSPRSQAAFSVGLVMAALSGLALLVSFLRRGPTRDPGLLLTMLAMSAVVMPYVLPRMHERYFFPADVLVFGFMVVRPSSWPVMLLMQLASVITYSDFLFPDLVAVFRYDGHLILFISSFLMTAAIFMLLRAYSRQARRVATPARSAVMLRL